MTHPITNQLTKFFSDIDDDKNGTIGQNYNKYVDALNYILELKDTDIVQFHNKYKINTVLLPDHIKQIKKYATETEDDRPVLFKLAYGIWLYSHTPNLI